MDTMAEETDSRDDEREDSNEFQSTSQGRNQQSLLGFLLWNGGSVYDAWFNATSVQVGQVLLTLPTTFAQMGLVAGIIGQLFYGFVGCWTCYLVTWLYADYRAAKEKAEGVLMKNHTIQWFEVLGEILGPKWKFVGLTFTMAILFCTACIQVIACGSTAYYLNDSIDKRTWTFIFGALFLLTVLLPKASNFRVASSLGILMTSYTAWYFTIGSALHGQKGIVKHSGPRELVLFFTGSTNLLYTFGGHAVTVEIMDGMWKPRKFKVVYLFAILYIFTLTIPSAITTYWAFGDVLLHDSNAFAVLPMTGWRDTAVILMLSHQIFGVGLITLPIYIAWEKLLRVHQSQYVVRCIARIPVVLLFLFVALLIPFFGPINSAVGSLFVSFGVYILPCMAHMTAYRTSTARKTSVEQPPFFIPSWTAIYCVNIFIVVWITVVGFGFGCWASIENVIRQVDTFGFFAKCFQCRKK